MLVRSDIQEGVVVALLGKPPNQYNCVMVMSPEGKYELQLYSDLTHCKRISEIGRATPYDVGERKVMRTSGAIRFLVVRGGCQMVVTHWAYI